MHRSSSRSRLFPFSLSLLLPLLLPLLLLPTVRSASLTQGIPTTIAWARVRGHPSSSSSSSSSSEGVRGWVEFKAQSANTRVTYELCGLADGVYRAYVHQFGDVWGHDASTTGDIFVGSCTGTCRQGAAEQKIGYLGDGHDITVSGGACASGTFTDEWIKLSVHQNAIVGRSLVVRNKNTNARVGQAVIARADTVATEQAQGLVTDSAERVVRASCVLEATVDNTIAQLTGSVTFEDIGDGKLDVKYFVYGVVDEGQHAFHVHHSGNISDPHGMSVLGHWVGNDCSPQTPCRPSDAKAQEVGMIGDGKSPMEARNLIAQGALVDSVMTLRGEHSIVGRSVIVHDSVDTSVRVAQCVIGAVEYADQTLPAQESGASVAFTTSAAAVLRATSESPMGYENVNGYVRFDLKPNTGTVRVKYLLTGLPPGNHTWHVHSYGNLCLDNGQSVGGHLVGDCNATNPCRPSHVSPQEVGMINDGAKFLVGDLMYVQGVFEDTVIKLNGKRSVIGRSLVIHGNGTDGNGIRIAQGEIGKTGETNRTMAIDLPKVYRASCRFRPTLMGPGIDGYVSFEWDEAAQYTLVKYTITGLAPGYHEWHAHDHGDLVDTVDAHAVGMHFVGDGRSTHSMNKAGMLNDGDRILADEFGVAYGVFRDQHIALNGNSSIIGRSIVVHGNGSTSAPGKDYRVAQCVVGIVSDSVAGTQSGECPGRLPADNFVREITAATCQFQPTSHNANQTRNLGTITFNTTTDPLRRNMTVRWNVCGLSQGDHSFHVHTFGDQFALDGSTVSSHFIGQCDNCRPSSSAAQEVGMVGNGAVKITADANGCASGELVDTVMRLNGVNSIIGRAVVIHGISGDSGKYAATCVIGRAESEAHEKSAVLAARMPVVRKAACSFEITTKKRTTTDADTGPAGGYMTFELKDINDTQSAIEVRWFLWGFPGDGTSVWGMPFHIHEMGNINDDDSALKVGGHFNGSCYGCRPAGVTQEVGMIGDGFKIVPKNKVAGGYVLDKVLRLNGMRSIIGRSVVLHAPKTTADRVAQCVVGVAQESYTPPRPQMDGAVPYVTRASAAVEPVGSNSARGMVTFELDAAKDAVHVRYMLHGLPASATSEVSVDETGNLCNDSSTGAARLTLQNVVSDANGVAWGAYQSNTVFANATNELVGRSVVVRSSAGAKPVLGRSIIGRVKEETKILAWDQAPAVGAASCILQPTFSAPNQSLTGYIAMRADLVYGSVRVEYEMHNLPVGAHEWVIHESGDTSSRDNAASTAGSFVGEQLPYDPRPAGVPQEVGQINDGRPVVADDTGFAYGTFKDYNLRLTGDPTQIIGRSIVLYGTGQAGGAKTPIAYCTIGSTTYEPLGDRDAPPACPARYHFMRQSAMVALEPTRSKTIPTSNRVSGRVYFAKVSNSTVQVTYDVCNLPSGGGLHKWHVRKYGNTFLPCGKLLGGPYYPLGVATNRQINASVAMDRRNCTQRSFQLPWADAPLVGRNSVVGRGLSISSANDELQLLAQGVVGRTDFETLDVGTPQNTSQVRRVTCNFRSTSNNLLSPYAGGYLNMETHATQPDVEPMTVRYFAYKLPNGEHAFHVHHMGDVTQRQGYNTENHFIGDCDNACRPVGVTQEIGYLGDGYKMEGDDSVIRGQFSERVAKLDGPRSVVGRSIIIHGDGTTAAPRVAQCVIGISHDADDIGDPLPPPAQAGTGIVPQITRAVCNLRGTGNVGARSLRGYVDMELLPNSRAVLVKYVVNGLEQGDHEWAVRKYGDLCDQGKTNHSRLGSWMQPSSGALPNMTADEHGAAWGQFNTTDIVFYGEQSLIGRSMAVYATSGTNKSHLVVATCVVGATAYHPTQKQPDHALSETAACAFEATDKNPRRDVHGYLRLTGMGTGNTQGEVHIPNLQVGRHEWHVHEFGDLISLDNGNSAGGHFVGEHPFPVARPFRYDEIGYINDGAALYTDRLGGVYTTFRDDNLVLDGKNSILGRTIIVHGGSPDGSADAVAFCIVGHAPPDGQADRCPLLDYTPPPPLESGDDPVSWTTIVAGIGGGVFVVAAILAAIRAHRIKQMREKGQTEQHVELDDVSQGGVRQVDTSAAYDGGAAGAAGSAYVANPTLETGTAEPLPDGWEQHHDEQGNVYYWNRTNNVSQWDVPRI